MVWEVTHLRMKGLAPLPGGGGSREKSGGWGARGERVGVSVAMLAGNFEDFSRLLDDYLDLHLFCLAAVMTGRLSRARGCVTRGQWRGCSEFWALTLLAVCHDGRVLTKASPIQNKRVSAE